MKTWQFWVIILIVIFIIIPIVIYGISLNAASKIVASNPQLANDIVKRGVYTLPVKQ